MKRLSRQLWNIRQSLQKGAAEIKALGIEPSVQVSLLNTISDKLAELKTATVKLEELVAKSC